MGLTPFCAPTVRSTPRDGQRSVPPMRRQGFRSRWKAILRAWPPAGAVFLVLSFFATVTWLYVGARNAGESAVSWLEPLAAILGGLGAFVLTAILIFRRVDSGRKEADGYGLSRGLATGYYFSYVRPVLAALGDPAHPVHAQMRAYGDYRLEGLVVGIPQVPEEFDPATHASLLADIAAKPGKGFELKRVEVEVPGRPRGIVTTVALGKGSAIAVIVDIPTTLAVVADFAEFVATGGADGASEDEFVGEARKDLIASSEADQFRGVLEEFVDVVNRVGARESRALSPALRLHLVPLDRLHRRMDELIYS